MPASISLELMGVISRGFEPNERVGRNYKLERGMVTLLVF